MPAAPPPNQIVPKPFLQRSNSEDESDDNAQKQGPIPNLGQGLDVSFGAISPCRGKRAAPARGDTGPGQLQSR